MLTAALAFGSQQVLRSAFVGFPWNDWKEGHFVVHKMKGFKQQLLDAIHLFKRATQGQQLPAANEYGVRQ